MSEFAQCLFCDTNKIRHGAPYAKNGSTIYGYECKRCGDVQYTHDTTIFQNDKKLAEVKYLISGYIRELSYTGKKTPVISLINHDDQEIIKSPIIPKTLEEQQIKILNYIKLETKHHGSKVSIDMEFDYSIAYAKNKEELNFIILSLKKKDYLEPARMIVGGKWDIVLTSEGMEYLENPEKRKNDSNICFVAMSFEPLQDSVYDNAIYKAIDECGYKPIRVDKEEYNTDINNFITEKINSSKFIVADFTQHKRGVYFEAGYALGKKLPIIWTCNVEDFKKSHFDTEHYNHIIWKSEQDLYNKLKKRIKETISKIIETEKTNTSDTDSIFTASENEEFESIYTNINKNIEVAFPLQHTKKPNLTEDQEVSFQLLQVLKNVYHINLLELVLHQISLNDVYFDMFDLLENIRKTLTKSQPPKSYDYAYSHYGAGSIEEDIVLELKTYDLIKAEKGKDNWGREGIINVFSEKFFRFKFWLETNNNVPEKMNIIFFR